MQNLEQDYRQLAARREQILQRTAVLEADEKRKAIERGTIIERLKQAGVNPDEPEKERERLQREVETHRETVEKALFEAEALLGATNTQPTTAQAVSTPSGGDLDLS